MKRELMSVLLGAALLVPMEAEAQRGRGGAADDGPRVQKLEPVTTGGRVAPRGRVAARAPYTRSRVVYTSRRSNYGRVPLIVRERVRLDGRLNPGELRRVLGQRTVKRIRDAGRRAGLRGAVRGHWIDTRRHGLVLVATMEGVDLAEFIDYDRDGWIDESFFLRYDRYVRHDRYDRYDRHDRGRGWVVR